LHGMNYSTTRGIGPKELVYCGRCLIIKAQSSSADLSLSDD
jgi:hypothetical protein